MTSPADLSGNALLAQLPEGELRRLRRYAEVLDVSARDQVYRPGELIEKVFFPISAVYSLVAVADGHITIEVATTGHEGMVGLPVFLGASSSPHAAYCQVSGQAVRLPTDGLRAVLANDGALHRALNRFAQATIVQVAQNVVCNSTHPAVQRAARWLLTTHDRVGRDDFDLTQEFFAQMLGLRRPTVSQIAQRLHISGLIDYRRGNVRILDRAGLEKSACDCYRIVRAEFEAMTLRADGDRR
jgi:CRP-like cAMP-binding protein